MVNHLSELTFVEYGERARKRGNIKVLENLNIGENMLSKNQNRKALVVVAHCDDAVLWMGGAIRGCLRAIAYQHHHLLKGARESKRVHHSLTARLVGAPCFVIRGRMLTKTGLPLPSVDLSATMTH